MNFWETFSHIALQGQNFWHSWLMVGTQSLPVTMRSFSYITCIKSKCLDLSGGASQARWTYFLPVFFSFNVLKCDICRRCRRFRRSISCRSCKRCKIPFVVWGTNSSLVEVLVRMIKIDSSAIKQHTIPGIYKGWKSSNLDFYLCNCKNKNVTLLLHFEDSPIPPKTKKEKGI